MNSLKAMSMTGIPEEFTYQISLPLWKSLANQTASPAVKPLVASAYKISGARVPGSSSPYLFAAGCIRKSAAAGSSQVDMRSVVSGLNGTFFSAEQR